MAHTNSDHDCDCLACTLHEVINAWWDKHGERHNGMGVLDSMVTVNALMRNATELIAVDPNEQRRNKTIKDIGVAMKKGVNQLRKRHKDSMPPVLEMMDDGKDVGIVH